MRTAHRAAAALTVLLTALATAGIAGPGTRPAAAAPPTQDAVVLDDAAKRELELDILTAFVPYAESFWRESDLAEPNTGRYEAVGSGVTQPRGAGNIAMVEATLLVARPDQASFGGVPRATMLDHTIQSIRHEALTNVLSGASYRRWGGGTWQASLETYGWAYAAHLLWDHLDQQTRALVRTVVTGEADILITKPIADATPGNTGAEDNAWNAPTPALAAVMFPDHPNRAAWQHAAKKLAINASSTAADKTSDTLVDGEPLSSWIASANLNEDLTIENHGFFNPIYQQVVPLLVGDAAIVYGHAGEPVPQAFSFRVQEIWQRILGRLADDNGDIVMPAGQDWISKDYQHLDYLSVLATRFRDPVASVLESRALQTVARRQATHADGSILGQPLLGYESMLAKRIAFSWWNHTLFGPSPVPSRQEYETARAATAGVTQYPSISVIAARLAGASAYMSWDTESPMGLWIPRGEQHLDDPLLTYYAKGSLVGSAAGAVTAYSCACAEDRFSTAGVIGDREFSMTAFPDGTALLLDRGTGTTFTYSLEMIPGLTGDRTIYSSGGTGLGQLPGTWVNVADRFGMVVAGGGGITVADLGGTNPTRQITGSAGTGSGNRGAALFANVDHATTSSLAGTVTQPAVPHGWSALVARAPDGTGRLAVARWAGPASATLSITDDRGAPVPMEEATLDGHRATFSPTLDAPASEGQTLRFFVDADAPLLARQDGEHRAVLTNTGTTPVRARTTYLAGDGATLTATRVIAPGETVTGRVLGGRLTLAGPEYEHLLAAGSTLAALTKALTGWQADGRISTRDAARLGALATAARRQIDTAAAAATSTDPVPATVAAAVAAASRTVTQLNPGDVPTDIRTAIERFRDDAAGALAQAAAALTVVLDVRALGPALPGEQLTVRVTALNRGLAAATAGVVTLAGPAGWTLPEPTAAFSALPPGGSTRIDLTGTVAQDASGDNDLTATLAYAAPGDRSVSATLTVAVQPLYDVTPDAAALPLAAGGWNRASFTLRSNAPRPLDIDLTVRAPGGVTATLDRTHVTVPAGGVETVSAELGNDGQTSGTGDLTVVATTSTGVTATARTQLRYSDNLAWNPAGAPFPAAFADSNQAAYPPARATDGDPATFWVSGGPATPGNGPTPTHPIALGVDFGHAVTVGSVTVVPRTNYGPKTYAVQVSADGASWTDVGQVTGGPNAAVTTSFTPVPARYLRLWITDGYDPAGSPPRNTQVAELQVRPA